MTDRGRQSLHQSEDTFRVGPSEMRWEDRRLIIEVDERGALPMLGRIKGTITLTPKMVCDAAMDLSGDGGHVWQPVAPVADITVDLNGPGWQWDGHGYFDSNFGTRALEADFDGWCWARYPLSGGRALCLYDAEDRGGQFSQSAVLFEADGSAQMVEAPARTRMARTLWGLSRQSSADKGVKPRQVLQMLEAPFYSRSAVRTQIWGEETTGVHEVLNLRRFRFPGIKAMLAVRVPRWTR